MSELKEFQKLVVANAQYVKGLAVGKKAPDFTLPNTTGKLISLSQCLKLGPVVLKFYRGEWCPICNFDLREIQQNIHHFKSFGAQILAVSPQNPDNALSAKQKNKLNFEVLSDSHQEVIKAYNLQFDPGADYHSRRDLTKENGDGSKLLPVPATFIINQDFTIVSAHVEANYTERMSAQDILEVLRIL